jgi:hypothetical protein
MNSIPSTTQDYCGSEFIREDFGGTKEARLKGRFRE